MSETRTHSASSTSIRSRQRQRGSRVSKVVRTKTFNNCVWKDQWSGPSISASLRHLGKSFNRSVCHQSKHKGTSFLQQSIGPLWLFRATFFKPIGRKSFSIFILLFFTTPSSTQDRKRGNRGHRHHTLVAEELVDLPVLLQSSQTSFWILEVGVGHSSLGNLQLAASRLSGIL